MTDGERGERGRTGLTGDTGTAGREGAAGYVGPQGEAGVPGRQGEAGVSGRQGEAGTAGLTGARGQTGRAFTRLQALALFAVVVAAFAVVSVRTELITRQLRDQQRQVGVNQTHITQLQYTQCTLRNNGTVRQNALIDSAIAAERRKPAPDLQRIEDLSAFKQPTVTCGKPPT